MKNKAAFIFIIMLLFNGTFLFSQETESLPAPETKKHKHFEFQIGFNASNFITSFLSLNNSGLPSTPYDFNGKVLFNFKRTMFLQSVGFRGGVGYRNTVTENNQPLNNQMQISEMKSLDYRLGIEAQKAMGSRVIIYAGLDYIMDQNVGKNTTSITSGTSGAPIHQIVVLSDSRAEGWGPVIGIQFNLNKYLCLGTEISCYQISGSTTNSTTNSTISNTPGFFPQYSYTKRRETKTLLPAFINFNIRF